MVIKGYPIFKKGLFTLTILSVFLFFFIMLFYPNAIAQAITDDNLEGLNGFENDDYRNAIAISPGEYPDLICQDDDWYKVNVPDLGEIIIMANLKVTIQFSHRYGNLNLVLYSTKAHPNDYNFLDISGLTANEEVVSASVPPGDYLIRVYSHPGVNNLYTMNMEILYPCQYVTYEWMDITNGEQAIELENDSYREIEIGFDFKFYDQVYKKVKVSSNGYLTFAERTLPYFNPNSPIPISATHRDAPPISIFSYWMDLRPDLGGGVFYKTDDQSNPSCKNLIVEWRDIPRDSAGGGITFQAVLFECTNQILLQYKDVIFSSQNDGYSLGNGATIGITNGRKTNNSIDRIATQYSYKNKSLTDQTAIIFRPSLTVNAPDTNQPNIEVSPTSHKFDDVFVNETSEPLEITIFNRGNADLNINRLTLSDEKNFYLNLNGIPNPIENQPVTIPNNEDIRIILTFTPYVEGTFSTELKIISDDPDTPVIKVSIEGTGLSIPTYDSLESFDCLANTNITTLMIDTNETLWIGTKEAGICSYNLYNRTFSCFNEDKGLAGNNVTDIAIGAHGEIWVATNPDIYGNTAGVSRFISAAGTFESYDPAQMGKDDDIEITDIVADNNGHLWVAVDSELLEFDGSYWKMYELPSYITSLNFDFSGRLWIGTDFLGIYVKDPFDLPRSVDFKDDFVHEISEIIIDPNGYLWMVGLLNNKNSLLFLSPDELIFSNQDALSPESFPIPDSLTETYYTKINDLFIHPITGNIFIASNNGFYIYDREAWDHFDLTNSTLSSLYVNSIIGDSYNDYWIGTEEGLSHFNSAAPYIVEVFFGDEHNPDNLPIDTSISVIFSEPMDRTSLEAFFQMINKDKNESIVNGSFHWNRNSTVIKFEPEASLAYNSNYEIRISNEAKDRSGMTIDTNVCEGDKYCSYFISTQYKPDSEKEQPSTNQYIQNTGFFNNYYRPDYWPNYNYNLSYWSGYSMGNYNNPYWTEYSMGKSLFKIPSYNSNFNLQYNVDQYSKYQFMGVPQIQSFSHPNSNIRDIFSPFNYNNYTGFNNYSKNTNQTYMYSLQGLNNYSKFYQNR